MPDVSPPDRSRLVPFDDCCAEFRVPPGTARRQLRTIPGLGWRIGARAYVDRAVAEDLHRPRPTCVKTTEKQKAAA